MTDPALRTRLTRWPAAWHLIVIDVLAGIVMTAIYIGFGTESGDASPDYTGPTWVSVIVAMGVGLPIAVRRKWPLPALAVVIACSSLATITAMTREPYTATILVMYMVALAEPRARSIIALVTVIVVAAGSLISTVGIYETSWEDALGLLVFLTAALIASWVIGHVTRRLRLAEMRANEERTEKAIVDERLRIAREMHDVVAHSLSVIAVKAGIANHVAEEHPGAARDALKVIETISRGSLTEMRRMLGVLRAEGDEELDLAPAPGLADIPALAERARQAGVGVDLDVSGVDDLPDGVALAVYRIVQEALTNVVKHAAPADSHVLVAGADGEVRVEVVDDGPGHRTMPERFSDEPGHGLAGMRERVMMYDGVFEAGRRPGGGFAVRARIPYAVRDAAEGGVDTA
ncbi:sensor histidine kinase [Phytomonospora endophytica]|uniref:histidine kinase n=1 Tax=Phytomonospora endophytica TaxID=714109 RepID=A0A841FXC4_9ACTN|nr:sensor histidine kinase [Phytomonospora endophytica]MBB6037119.1 signal transduction histidine kinase [Phytomonospora endophytica]